MAADQIEADCDDLGVIGPLLLFAFDGDMGKQVQEGHGLGNAVF